MPLTSDIPTSAEMKARFTQVEQVYGKVLVDMVYAGTMRVTEVTTTPKALDATNEGLVLCNRSGGLTLTLPAADCGDGMFWLIKNIYGSGNVTIHTDAGSNEEIDGVNCDDGETGLVLATMDLIGLYCDGTGFYVTTPDPDVTAVSARVTTLEDTGATVHVHRVLKITEAGKLTFLPANTHPALKLISGRVILYEVPDSSAKTITLRVYREVDDADMTDLLTFAQGTDAALKIKDFAVDSTDHSIAKDDSMYFTLGGDSTTLGLIGVDLVLAHDVT